MEFPYQGKVLTASHPWFGPANSKTLLAEIEREQFKAAAFPELVSFIHHTYGKDSPQAEELKMIMNTKYFIGFTGVLYLPHKSEVCFVDYPSFDGGSVVDVDDLLKRMKLGEARDKVSLENVEKGPVSWKEIPQNPFFKAVCGGEEGAEKVAELASLHTDKTGLIFVPKMSNFTSPQARIALLYSYQSGKSLSVSLNGAGYSINGHAIGLVNK